MRNLSSTQIICVRKLVAKQDSNSNSSKILVLTGKCQCFYMVFW